jgi:hypothetical protein
VALDRVIVSACHGDRYWLAIEHWAAHLAELDGSSIEIVSLDGGAYRGDVPGVSTVSMDVAGVKLQWGVGERYQIERIIWHLDHGRVGLHVDLDVRVKRAFSLPLSRLPRLLAREAVCKRPLRGLAAQHPGANLPHRHGPRRVQSDAV